MFKFNNKNTRTTSLGSYFTGSHGFQCTEGIRQRTLDDFKVLKLSTFNLSFAVKFWRRSKFPDLETI